MEELLWNTICTGRNILEDNFQWKKFKVKFVLYNMKGSNRYMCMLTKIQYTSMIM